MFVGLFSPLKTTESTNPLETTGAAAAVTVVGGAVDAVAVDTTASTSGGELFSGTPAATEALQVKIERCAAGWTVNGTTGLLECAGGALSVLANGKAVGANGILTNLNLAAGGSNDLVATFSLPGAADNGAQGDSGVLSFTLVGHQRTAQDS